MPQRHHWLQARASVVARPYRAAVVRVAEAAGEVVGEVTVELDAMSRRIERAVARHAGRLRAVRGALGSDRRHRMDDR